MAETKRTLHLKYAHFKSGRQKDFVPPPIDKLLLQVGSAAPNFGLRHYPPPSALPAGTSCAFLENIRQRPHGDGVLFDVYAYTYGLASDQFHPNFSSAKPDISTGQIKDQAGKVREIVHAYRCLAWGQAVIVEYNRSAGGIHLLEALLSDVFHRICQKGMPRLSLLDVMTNQLDKAIAAGGGVDILSLRLVGGSKPPHGAYVSERMVDLKRRVKNTKQVSIVWESDDAALDAKNVIEVADEYAGQESLLDRINIKLKNGGSIAGLGRYRERRRVPVQVLPSGALAVTDLETGMCNYLDELRQIVDGWRVIDDKGNFVAPKIVSTKG